MYSSLYNPDWSELFKARLQQIERDLRGLNLATREEYQAEVYSRLNQMFALGNRMTPLKPVLRQGPASVGDVQTNMRLLNADASAVALQLLASEREAGRLLNLFAATQNALRQQVRETVYQSTNRLYLEGFVSDKNLINSENVADLNAGVAYLPLVGETEVKPSGLRSGPLSSATTSETALSLLLDNQQETSMVWEGDALELIFEFNQAEIINRVRIEMDDYRGLTMDELTSSPDGSLRENILAEVGADFRRMDGSSGKFTGEYCLDFDPKHVKQIRLLIRDRVGQKRIAIRSVTFYRRQYQPKGIVQSRAVAGVSGDIFFTTLQHTSSPLTGITHMVSDDGVHYRVVQPDTRLNLPPNFWYRAQLERLDDKFSAESNPLELSGNDPTSLDTSTVVKNISTVDLGAGIIERTIEFESVVGGVLLKETPLPRTLVVTAGMITVNPEDGPVSINSPGQPNIVTFVNNKLNFLYEVTGVVVRYQTSALGAAGLMARKNFYSPYLYEVRFERD
jgi:hypothetical protein